MEVTPHITPATTSLPSYKPPHAETLDQLIRLLHEAFAGDEVDKDYVQELMESYKSNPLEWKKFAKFDRYKYTRNLVDEGNGKFDLMLLCWNPSQYSPIHDHTDAHCFMKILDGGLEEVRYEWPEEVQQEDDLGQMNNMKVIGTTPLPLNSVCYMSDELGVHRVGNRSNTDNAVSLHLYVPPFATCQIFDETTGRRCKCTTTFYSRYGEKVKYCSKN